ncbi:uncharacterized protein [Centruroides vittatus]|uniref:uncharacterized protein n=1 Tax=Centruroides vittatus TaxID=120091 RepID=UPI00350F0DB6
MIFYITVTNSGQDILKLRVDGEHCCQKINAEETDCVTMKLIGGEIGELKHGDTRNLTFTYPNISSNNDKMEYNINFDTLLPKKHHAVPPLLSDYLANEEIKECSSVDEDPLNDCLPVIYLIKYSGKRNYFNHTTRRCQKITECVSETERNLPDIVYIPESNTCRNLSSKLIESDLKWFKEGKVSTALSKMHGYPLHVDCHNGKANLSYGWCHCDPGWTSALFDMSSFNPDVMAYHMCTIWGGTKTKITHYFTKNF